MVSIQCNDCRIQPLNPTEKIMRTFKDTIKDIGIALAIGVGALSANAQNFRSINFLLVPSITLTNTKCYTNIISPNLGGTTTNIVGLIWTNFSGAQVVAGTNDTTQLTTDVSLWGDRDGMPPLMFIAPTNQAYASGYLGTWNIAVHILSGGSGANSAVNFTIVPVPDGVHESTISGDQFSFGVTAVTTSEVTLFTNAPAYKWAGCKSIRLKTAVNTDTDASSQVVVDSVTLNGFIP